METFVCLDRTAPMHWSSRRTKEHSGGALDAKKVFSMLNIKVDDLPHG